MYHISFFEEGRFITHIGGPIYTLPDALAQLRAAAGEKAERVAEYEGYKFDRSGVTCALFITDDWNQLIKTIE